MQSSCELFAKILRTDHRVLARAVAVLDEHTGKRDVMDRLWQENQDVITHRLSVLGVTRDDSARTIFRALIEKIRKHDSLFFAQLGSPDFTTKKGCESVGVFVKNLAGERKGFFIKHNVFIAALKKHPPYTIMTALGYATVDELLAKENILELAAALRFLEGGEWLNTIFFDGYATLTPDDFEERPIEIVALGEKWRALAQSFVKKKYHNISHLKELGVIFIIPALLDAPGELLRTLSLLAHYVYEIDFYSKLFFKNAKNRETFFKNFSSLLRGDEPDNEARTRDGKEWLVVQQYLAKFDENDWRLSTPHVNPEAIHWEKAEEMLAQMGASLGHGCDDISFWVGLNWVGDYFSSENRESLVSFDIVDNSMSLVQEKELVKYLYHHQESLWNRIYAGYFGQDQLERDIHDHLIEGYISIV